jgi:hypothetical protein
MKEATLTGLLAVASFPFVRLRRCHQDGRSLVASDPNGIRIARRNDFRTVVFGLEVVH